MLNSVLESHFVCLVQLLVSCTHTVSQVIDVQSIEVFEMITEIELTFGMVSAESF